MAIFKKVMQGNVIWLPVFCMCIRGLGQIQKSISDFDSGREALCFMIILVRTLFRSIKNKPPLADAVCEC